MTPSSYLHNSPHSYLSHVVLPRASIFISLALNMAVGLDMADQPSSESEWEPIDWCWSEGPHNWLRRQSEQMVLLNAERGVTIYLQLSAALY